MRMDLAWWEALSRGECPARVRLGPGDQWSELTWSRFNSLSFMAFTSLTVCRGSWCSGFCADSTETPSSTCVKPDGAHGAWQLSWLPGVTCPWMQWVSSRSGLCLSWDGSKLTLSVAWVICKLDNTPLQCFSGSCRKREREMQCNIHFKTVLISNLTCNGFDAT